ncbi:MAG: hypothetical protein IAE99_10400 [Rhodothermales bacterium]|nr:hypothetical protein [Rhodothermales bacterium]
MSQPVRLADLLPAALDALGMPHLTRVAVPTVAHAPVRPLRDDARPGLSQVLVRVDATLRRAA